MRLGAQMAAIPVSLDQHRERQPKDAVIAASFNTYRFPTFKKQVIELIGRVTRVSVDTIRITEEMSGSPR
jgi:predicted helicase